MSKAPDFIKTCTKSDIQIEDSDDDYEVVQTLCEGKTDVYVCYSHNEDFYKVLKVFPKDKGNLSPNYMNEKYFTFLQHPNVIQIMESVDDNQKLLLSPKNKKIGDKSSILMEYATHGTFYDLIMHQPLQFSDKIIRTYFHQLIEAIEYLHKNRIAHLDIKLENVGLGDHSVLKLMDFDLCYCPKYKQVMSKGTVHSRAPELAKGFPDNPYACDIFSAGIFLFMLKSKGIYPFKEAPKNKKVLREDEKVMIELSSLLEKNQKEFWKVHSLLQGKTDTYFSPALQQLFTGMCQMDPSERFTIDEIKKSEWYNQPIYTPKELEVVMKRYVVNYSHQNSPPKQQ